MSEDRRFALGCFRATALPVGGEQLFGLPVARRRLATTTGSFTRALHRHTGHPVVVRRLSEGWRGHQAGQWPVPRGTRVWTRRVRLESGDARVEALTEVVGPLSPRLRRAITGLADTPLMEVLASQPCCRRLSFRVHRQGRTITRETVYRIHLARVRVTEWFDIDLR
ncbi:MAG: chorismate--pyruvate lyase family protein [Guyparkeria sp.]